MKQTAIDLFGEEVSIPVPQKTGLTPSDQMRRMYGEHDGTCKDCVFLLRTGRNRTYLKCEKFVITRGPGTDWRAKWPACGLFKEREES